jgi:hypothetical protein
MRKLSLILAVVVMLGVALSVSAQMKRVSPHETISLTVDKNRVTIVYGRPYSKDPKGDQIRKIWGGLVPYGKPWRLGADEATLLLTQQPLAIGDVTLPAGAYTLFFLPVEEGPSKLIINKQLGQWGLQYDEKQDLARVDLKKETLDKSVDQLTIAIERTPPAGGVIKIMWETTQFSVPISLKQ